jgi:hypothetical protein
MSQGRDVYFLSRRNSSYVGAAQEGYMSRRMPGAREVIRTFFWALSCDDDMMVTSSRSVRQTALVADLVTCTRSDWLLCD